MLTFIGVGSVSTNGVSKGELLDLGLCKTGQSYKESLATVAVTCFPDFPTVGFAQNLNI